MKLYHLWKDEDGQDLVEYTLLLAAVCLFSTALIISSGGAMEGIWTKTQNNLDSARTAAGG